MVAVLNNQVIRIAIVICSLVLHEFCDLVMVQICYAHINRLSKSKAGALVRLDFKDATSGIVVSSESIFNTMYCKIKFYFVRIQQMIPIMSLLSCYSLFLSIQTSIPFNRDQNQRRKGVAALVQKLEYGLITVIVRVILNTFGFL